MVYGVGNFFEELSPQLSLMGIKVECLIDTKAEREKIIVNGRKVISLKKALEGRKHATILVASAAFGNEIANKISETASSMNINVEIIYT